MASMTLTCPCRPEKSPCDPHGVFFKYAIRLSYCFTRELYNYA